MWFPLLLQCTWWLVTNKAMVDYEVNLDGWLEDATLFPVEPNDYSFNFNELLNSGKADNEAGLVTGLPDLDWFDAKVDLSIFDGQKDFQLQPFESTETLNLEDATNLLFGLIDSNLDTSYLSSDISKNELNEIFEVDAQIIDQQVASPGILDFPLASPCYESTSEASSPAAISCITSTEETTPELCVSPDANSTYSSIDDGRYESISETCSPTCFPFSKSGTSSNTSTDVKPAISVTVCEVDVASDPEHLEETLSIDEITNSVREKRYINDGKEVPKVHVSLKNVFHPYAKAAPRKRGERFERKKVQNKEAAARYRIKKRLEEKGLSGDVACLESEQKELKKKHDSLLNEIKYLKSLMREVLQKKGILK